MQVSLVMFKADGSRRDFPVTKDRVVVGRKNNCDLRIPLSSVSREHCEITIEDDRATLRDLGSSNGTFHNSIRVQETTLSAGDEVVVGPVVFVVVIDGKPEEVDPVRTVVDSEADDAAPSASMPTMVPHTDGPAGAGDPDDAAEPGEPGGPPEEPGADEVADSILGDEGEDDIVPGLESDDARPAIDTDLDDDPIAALERMAEAERLSSTSSGVDPDLDDPGGDNKK